MTKTVVLRCFSTPHVVGVIIRHFGPVLPYSGPKRFISGHRRCLHAAVHVVSMCHTTETVVFGVSGTPQIVVRIYRVSEPIWTTGARKRLFWTPLEVSNMTHEHVSSSQELSRARNSLAQSSKKVLIKACFYPYFLTTLSN